MRLIDADELKNKFWHGDLVPHKEMYHISEIRYAIDNAPTVEYPFYQEAYQTGYEEGKNERQKDDDLCETCRYGDDCEFSCKIFSGCRTTRCYKYEEADNETDN